jgi:hypothetical protein
MKNFRAHLYNLNHAAAGVTLQTKAYPMHPLNFSHAVRCLATAEGIPYASFLFIRSLSHAVRCLATAEGIPYASRSFLHPLSLASRPVPRDS